MLSTYIDFSTAVRILVSIVKEFGADHRAPQGDAGCTYFVMDESPTTWGGVSKTLDQFNLRPVCIVGQAFARLGIQRALLSGAADQFATCTPDAVLWSNAETMGVEFSADARMLFRKAQEKQDSGETWRDSVEQAVEAVQESIVSEFKANHEAFGWRVSNETAELPAKPEPLAEWEKELLSPVGTF